MHLTPIILLAAAGVSAHPSGHAHMHRHVHEKRAPVPEPNPAVGDLVTATVMGKVVSWTNTYDGKGSPFMMGKKPASSNPKKPEPAALATPASSAPVAEQSAPAPPPPPSHDDKKGKDKDDKKGKDKDDDKVSAQGIKSKVPFCNGAPKVISRATLQQIAYTGNTGAKGNWGCNMMLVADAKTADLYQYTAKFTNNDKDSQTCTCFNKIGPDGGINGFFHEGISWKMAPGATQYVAYDSNSQGGCVCNPGDVLRKTVLGQFSGTWLEFDFENTSNKGWSGADASSLVPQRYGLQVDGLQVCSQGTCSTIWPGGRGDNAYLGGMEDLDGIGLNIPPGKCQLDVKVGYNS